jgi:hypothetical protein
VSEILGAAFGPLLRFGREYGGAGKHVLSQIIRLPAPKPLPSLLICLKAGALPAATFKWATNFDTPRSRRGAGDSNADR